MITPGEKHLTASVLVATNEQPVRVLLLHHRKHQTWLQPGGHVELFENPWETAVRELEEETGLDVSAYLPAPRSIAKDSFQLTPPDFVGQYLVPATSDQPAHYHVDWLYVVKIPQAVPLTNEKEKSYDIGWFSLEQIENLPMFANTKFFIKKLLT